ncbi:FxSxx-COOH system tetratricopeptide repeat protein [Streptomyces sp. NPDC047880]|uniref:FxSxx-COOH system tetratricopeptide repeat protein n=1 Tax=Streptomyces sp. NPDC047880 TaxID=3155626 RepID=UPI0034525F7A
MTPGTDGQIVTFYSQKGGTGRTMAVANVAWILASNGYHVLAADWDVEAPGLHRYFHPFLDAATSAATTGVLNLFSGYVTEWRTKPHTESAADLRRRLARVLPHAVSVDWTFPEGGSLDYMPAGRQDGEYLTHLMDFSWREFAERFGGTRFLEALRHDMKSHYDFTLIDSRCGVSDLVGLCTIDMPDILVNCFTLSSQSIEGAARMARSILQDVHPRPLRILPVAMRVADDRDDRLAAARELVRMSFQQLPAASRTGVEVPHRSDYAYEETLAAFGDPPGEPNSLLAAFELLTELITEGRVRGLPPLDDELRRRHLASYVRPLSPIATPLRLWYAPQDRMWADWVGWLLAGSGFEVITSGGGSEPGPWGGAPRTLALLSSSFLRSPQSRTLGENMGGTGSGPSGKLIPLRIEPVALTPPFSDYEAVDLTSLDEPGTAEALLRGVGLSGEAAERALGPARPRFPRRTPDLWEAPARNPFFVGRDRLLDQLAATLKVSRQQAVILPHDGLAATGRTQLAVEYAHRFQAAYDLVWWIRAHSRESVLLSLAQLAERMGLRNGDDVPTAARRALDALDSGSPSCRWLLVYDNAAGRPALSELLPAGPQGHVLVTSRDRTWSESMHPVWVDAFTREQSIELLRRRAPSLSAVDADRIAATASDLPLAVAQAGAWLAQFPSAQDYLHRLTARSDARAARGADDGAAPAIAAGTAVALDALAERAPAALRLLALCSVLAPQPLPLALVCTDTALRLLRPHDDALHEPMLVDRQVQELSRLGLAEVDLAGHTLKVHRVVQHLVTAALPAGELDEVRHEAHLLLRAAVPRRDDSAAEADDLAFERLWPHFDHAGADACPDSDTRVVLLERVRRTAQHGMPARALELGRRLDRSWTAVDGGDDDQHVLQLRNHQATALRSLGANDEAYGLDARTLARQRELLPPGHSHTLITAAGLAEDLRALGRFGEALELAREVHTGFHDLFGEEHPQTLTAAEALARSYRLVGDYSAARERSLDTWQRQCRVLGDGHPAALASALGLARDLRELGDYAGSVRVLRPALESLRRQNTHGALRATVSLSVSLRRIGERHEADELAAHAEEGYTTERERDDPDWLVCGVNLAALTAGAGDLAAARTVISRLQHGVAQLRGPEHPDNAVCDHNLAAWLRTAGETDEALAAATRTVRSFGRFLGDAHPYTLFGRLTMANVLGDMERFASAESMARACAQALRTCLGEGHPDTLIADLSLAVTLRSMGRAAEAGRLRDRAVSAFDKRLGPGHPWTAAGRGWQRVDRDLEFLLPA